MEAAGMVSAKWALLQLTAVTSIPDEETAPKPAVLAVTGSRQVNDSQNHKGGSGPASRESKSGGSQHPSWT